VFEFGDIPAFDLRSIDDRRLWGFALKRARHVAGFKYGGRLFRQEERAMKSLHILGVAALGLSMLAYDANAQRGGAVRGGMRGAVVGGMVGGSTGAATGAKVDVVTGATRSAINRESQARTQYQSTAAYQNAPRSNFDEAPPEALGVDASGSVEKAGEEAVIRKNGKPVVGITFPSDWKQTTGNHSVSAVSGDGQAYAMLATLEEVAGKEAGIKKVKDGLDKYLKDIKYDEPSETKGGALVVTGTGKGKKAGVDVVFAAALFDAEKGELAGAAFVVDAKIEDHYKETIRGICETLRRADDFKE
jgi:hypothetical protein